MQQIFEEGDQIHTRVWNYEFIQLPLVIKENQSRPTVTEAEISGLLNSLKERYAVLVALVAGTGLRIGEALAVPTEDFDPDCQVLHIRRSVWHRCEQAPKTPNAIRLVDIPEALAQVLRRYAEGKEWLPLHDAGRLLDQRNSLKAVQGAGKRGGIPRLSALSLCGTSPGRRPGEPDQTMDGPFAELDGPLRCTITVRGGRAGLGFELGELGYKLGAPICPSLVA